MQRRKFLQYAGTGAVIATGMSACKEETSSNATVVTPSATFEWKMVTTWPKNFPGLGTGAEFLAKQINEMSSGRLKVKVYGAGELVSCF